jgi:hypothetical protein
MTEFETKALEILSQIAEDVRWLRVNTEAVQEARSSAVEEAMEAIQKYKWQAP